MVIVRMMYVFSGELFDGFDEEYQCPVLDEDRVSSGWVRVWGPFNVLQCCTCFVVLHCLISDVILVR